MHMPFCHVITSFLASLRLDMYWSNVTPLSKQFNHIWPWPGMIKGDHTMTQSSDCYWGLKWRWQSAVDTTTTNSSTSMTSYYGRETDQARRDSDYSLWRAQTGVLNFSWVPTRVYHLPIRGSLRDDEVLTHKPKPSTFRGLNILFLCFTWCLVV